MIWAIYYHYHHYTMRIKRGVRQVRTLQIERYLLPRLCYLMINVMLIYSQCLYSWMKPKVRVYFLQLQPVPELVRVLSINYSLLIKWIIVTYLLSIWFFKLLLLLHSAFLTHSSLALCRSRFIIISFMENMDCASQLNRFDSITILIT